MSRLPSKYLLTAALEGAHQEDLAVTVFRPRGRRFFHVFFRQVGRQRNLSTGCDDFAQAKAKAAEIVALELRKPTEAAREQSLREEVAQMRQKIEELTMLLKQNVAAGIGGMGSWKPKVFVEATAAFLAEKSPPQVSEAHYRDLERVCRLLGEWCAARKILSVHELTHEELSAWLKAGGWEGKTFNARISTAAILLNWCVMKGWVGECAADRISRKRLGGRKRPQTLTLDKCRRLMDYVETHYPEYAAFFALALFAGVRSSAGKGGGELRRLLEQVQEEGWEAVDGGNGYIWIDKPKTVTGEAGGVRRAHVSANCRAWIEAHPEALVPGVKAFKEIREAIGVPKNAMRHSAVTGYVMHTQQLATATLLFGHDEATLRKFYLDAWSKDQAAAFYEIYPKAAKQRRAA